MGKTGAWVGGALLIAALGGWIVWGAGAGSRSPDLASSPSAAPAPEAQEHASHASIPPELGGVYLGMGEGELTRRRPAARRAQPADDPRHVAYDEALGDGSQALYFFAQGDRKLARVQLARQLADAEAVAPRVQGLVARHGAPSGVWDCPQTEGGLPTRRFTWTRGNIGVMDVYLVLRDRIAATLYVSARAAVLDSLAQAKCVPTPPERVSMFPTLPPDRSARGAP